MSTFYKKIMHASGLEILLVFRKCVQYSSALIVTRGVFLGLKRALFVLENHHYSWHIIFSGSQTAFKSLIVVEK